MVCNLIAIVGFSCTSHVLGAAESTQSPPHFYLLFNSLGNNDIRDVGATALASNLKENQTMKTLK